MDANKKRKKSGSENRKMKKKRLEEEAKYQVQMKNYFSKKTISDEEQIHDTQTIQETTSQENNFTSIEDNSNPAISTDFSQEFQDNDYIGSVQDSDDLDESKSDVDDGDVACTEGAPKLPTDIGEVFIVSSILGKPMTHEEKLDLLNQKPCQPPGSELKTRKKKIGTIDRHCSENVFCRKDGTNRSWLTYCLENDALYCIPCLLFSDETLRGQNQRKNQGTAFSRDGFSNWKKQYTAIPEHEASQSHINSKIAQVMFLQKRSMKDILKTQEEEQERIRRRQVEANRKILKRVIDTTIFLGKQELAFRGHRESLASGPSTNKGNFLETLKYLAEYDDIIALHLENIEREHLNFEAKKKGTKKGDKARRFGRGSKLTFLSNDMQNKLIEIISKEIAKEVVNLIKNSVAWAVIADTTPDVSKHEQFSLCVRVVIKSGEVSEHLLFCTRAEATTAEKLVNLVSEEMNKLNVQFENVVAQTYDGASNMSGKYNGLQAKFKELAGEHIIFVHCYAHNLNLVLSDAATASVDVEKLFDNLQALYVMTSKSQPIHQLFEDCQKELEEKTVRSLKRIDTVRWSAREFSLDIFVKRYNAIMVMLQKIVDDTSFKPDKRSTADGMLKLFSTKQFLATAYLFRDIFAITGPLSRTLQSVNIDFGSALDLLDSAQKQLVTLRANPQAIIDSVDLDFEGAEWEKKRIVKKRRMPGETSGDEPTGLNSVEDKWIIDVFNVALDQVTTGLNNRFSDSKHVLEAFTIFSPRSFTKFFEIYPTTSHVEAKIREFCQTYKIDSYRCAAELFSFAKVFGNFDLTVIENKAEIAVEDSDHYYSDSDGDDDDEESSTKSQTFIDCLSVLTNKSYNLVDAYPTLVRVYSIAIAIPITSCSAERCFSTLKRIKSRLRSSMLQDRLEGLMLMSTERKILLGLDMENIIDLVGRSSSELRKALL